MLRDRLKQLLLPCFSFRFTNYSTSNAMSSAWSALTSSAATEHGTGPLLQSTAGATQPEAPLPVQVPMPALLPPVRWDGPTRCSRWAVRTMPAFAHRVDLGLGTTETWPPRNYEALLREAGLFQPRVDSTDEEDAVPTTPVPTAAMLDEYSPTTAAWIAEYCMPDEEWNRLCNARRARLQRGSASSAASGRG